MAKVLILEGGFGGLVAAQRLAKQHKDIWTGELGTIRKDRLWSWAKQLQVKHWEVSFA